jgi:exodeoxyribonuclease VIII
MEIGTAIHTALLEPERFNAEYVLLKETKDRRASEYKAAVKVHGSERVLVSSEAAHVAGMQEQVLSHTPIPEGYSELSVFATCPDTGVLMKCRFDRLTHDGLAVDVKKTRDSRPDEFAKSVFNYRYHVQDAFYRYVFECATGQQLRGFEFLAVEENPPHSSAFYELCEESQRIGHDEAMRDLQTYADCVNSNSWPTYGGKETTIISLPAWALAKYEDDLVEEIV